MNNIKVINKKDVNNKRPLLSLAGKLTVVGLAIAAVGILTLFATGWVYQPVPIGTILLLTAACLVAFGRWSWTLVSGFILSIFIFVMAFIAPGLFDRMSHPSVIGAFVGTWIQMLGLATAITAGSIANIQYNKARS